MADRMAAEGVTDSPREHVAEHIHRYLVSNGDDGFLWGGSPTLLLTTRGRITKRLRRTALIFGRFGEDYVVVASRGGADDHPQWFRNLAVDPEVMIQVKGEIHHGRARIASDEERDELWKLMVAIYPSYDDYRARTSREIPVVVIEVDRA